MKKIRRIGLLIISVLLISSLFINCYATAVAVTKENLNESLQKFVSSDTNEKNYKITVSDSIITITADGENYNINYDLTEKPKFTLEIPIEQGMSYSDFKEKTDNLMLLMIGYIAVANIQGVGFEDASAYFLMSYLGNAFNGSWSSENSYVIIDDTNMADGVTIDRDESNPKNIYASKFGERVMEYVNATYKDKQTITDSNNGINSYEFTTERKDITDTSCKLVSSLSVNLDADFSKLNKSGGQTGESLPDKGTQIDTTSKTDNTSGADKIYTNNKQEEKTNINSNNKNSISIDSTTSKANLPKTGLSSIIYTVILFSVILTSIFIIKLKKYEDIK